MLVLGALGCSSDDEEDAYPFVGKWRLISLEYGDTVKDLRSNNASMTFFSNGRMKSSTSSDFSYCYDDQYLYIHYPYQIEFIYNYSFSSESKILRLKLINVYPDNNRIQPPMYLGKTQVYIKSEE